MLSQLFEILEQTREALMTYKAFVNGIPTKASDNGDGYFATTAKTDKEAIRNLRFRTAKLLFGSMSVSRQKEVRLYNFQKQDGPDWELIAAMVEERSANQLIKTTPKRFKIRSEDISVRLVIITKSGKMVYKTLTPSNKNVHRQFVKPVPPSKKIENLDQDIIVYCDCANHKYENEYSLWKTNASHIASSNGKPPLKTNKAMRKKVCKHLLAVFEDIKKRTRK